MRQLLRVHKILLGAGMALGAVMVVYGATQARPGFAVAGAVAAGAIVVYWRKIVRGYDARR